MSTLVKESFDLFSSSIAVRDPAEIRRNANAVVERAINEAHYARAGENQARVLGVLDIRKEGDLKDLRAFKYTNDQVKEVLAGFCLARGNLSENRYWIRFDRFKIFVSFPLLSVAPYHGALQWAVADKMMAAISAGKSSNLIDFVERSYRITDGKKYLFAKGYTLCDDKDTALAVREDISRVISSMTENKGVTNPKPVLELKTIVLSKKLS